MSFELPNVANVIWRLPPTHITNLTSIPDGDSVTAGDPLYYPLLIEFITTVLQKNVLSVTVTYDTLSRIHKLVVVT